MIKTKLSENRLFFACLATGLLVFLLFYALQYTATEGFNPSDDGVVLAQAYRLINGEIPHSDFISIRPVFSGVLHSVHFFSPLPLLDSARWFVVLQFFIISLAITSIIIKLSDKKFSILTAVSLQLLLFAVEVLNYNMFPWTTLDAVFLSTIGMWIFVSGNNKSQTFKNIASVFFFVLAATSRQNFLLPAAFISFLVLRQYFWEQRLVKAVLVLVIGWFPVLIYFGMLLKYNAFPDFIAQLSGRTELFQTGVLQYLKQWIYSPILFLHFLVYLFFILAVIYRDRKPFFINIFRKYFQGFAIIAVTWIFFMIVVHFMRGEINIILLPFELFWILVDLLLFAWIVRKPNEKVSVFIILVLVIAYTSSISLGDNSPVFAVGLLAGAALYLIYYLVGDTEVFTSNRLSIRYAFFAVSTTIFALGVVSQKHINYRDLKASQLNYQLNAVHPGFGSVRTNSVTGAYFKELGNLFDSIPGAKDHCVVLPHNAMFYPMFDSRNPLPLDWMQPAEFVGNENRVFQSVKDICNRKGMYFIIDKYDIKKLYLRTVKISANDFGYMKIISSSCKKIDTGSKYFDVYVTRPDSLTQ